MNDKLLKRMQRLLAMANDSANEHEAAIAMRRLHGLLAKHKLSIDDIQEKNEGVEVDTWETVNWPWKREVLHAVAELYFCKAIHGMTKKNYADYHVIGKESDRIFAVSIIKMIFRVIEKEANVKSKELFGKRDSTFVSSFRNGAADRIVERCDELVRMAQQGKLEDEEGTTLPALANAYQIAWDNALDHKIFDNSILVKTRTNANDILGKAFGREAGDNVQLSRAIQQKNAPNLLEKK